jgi:hydrogenase maturation protease
VAEDPVRAIADAVLYEGYILWPYRRSALKNQRRFTFGGVHPPLHAQRHPDDRSTMQTEVLLRGRDQAQVEIGARFLHVVERRVMQRRGGLLEPVDELLIGGERYLSWQEAAERELHLPALSLAQLQVGHELPIAIEARVECEELPEDAGVLRRSWRQLQGAVRAQATPLAPGLWRLRVVIRNQTAIAPEADRQRALEQTFCSTHTILRVAGDGAFVSLADPPAELAAAAAACENVGTWPVPVGQPGDCSTILSAPIILEDYPRVAPESPGDLFDGGEIDQLLTLSILAMTDEEKAEMAACDPRAREILERTEALTPEQLMALHGAVRELGMGRAR